MAITLPNPRFSSSITTDNILGRIQAPTPLLSGGRGRGGGGGGRRPPPRDRERPPTPPDDTQQGRRDSDNQVAPGDLDAFDRTYGSGIYRTASGSTLRQGGQYALPIRGIRDFLASPYARFGTAALMAVNPMLAGAVEVARRAGLAMTGGNPLSLAGDTGERDGGSAYDRGARSGNAAIGTAFSTTEDRDRAYGGSWFKEGGPVPGRGPVPITAHGGEYVMTEDAVRGAGGPGAMEALQRRLEARSAGDAFSTMRADMSGAEGREQMAGNLGDDRMDEETRTLSGLPVEHLLELLEVIEQAKYPNADPKFRNEVRHYLRLLGLDADKFVPMMSLPPDVTMSTRDWIEMPPSKRPAWMREVMRKWDPRGRPPLGGQ